MAHILDEPGVPLIRVPEYMAREGAYQIVRMDAGFAEVLPGLEAAIFWPPDDGGKIVAHFRLTPKEGAGMADLNAKAGAFAKEHGSFSLHFDAARNYLRPDDAPWSLELHGRETEWGGLTAEEALDFAAAELGAAP